MKPTLQVTSDTTAATVARTFTVVDVENVGIDGTSGCKTFLCAGKPKTVNCSLLIVGGGTGGVAATVAATRKGLQNVCLIEETSWLGGQLTAQAVSAPDENFLVETTGATRTYKELREFVRQHYRNLGATDGGARFEPWLDPGNCWVSRVSFEPKVALAKIADLLTPATSTKQLRVYMRCKAVSVKIERQRIKSILCVNLDTGRFIEFRCKFCLDATELGDLLPLAGLPYSSGAESREQTAEEHAPEKSNSQNVQDFTYPFMVEFCSGENHTVAKPPFYDHFNAAGKFTFNNYRMFENASVSLPSGATRELLPFWEYRRVIARENFKADVFPNDIAMINWESNDLRGENIIDQAPDVMAQRLARGKALSLGFLYWLQTEAPRDDGGEGYPELKLRQDLTGTSDGLSKYPYIRESRRIKAAYTIVESDITRTCNPGPRARLFSDSLGIGHYPVDVHGEQEVPGVGQATAPFQIPAGAMVQTTVRNLLPACKNIGTTHVTNGAYRLHPIEWAIGEAAGLLAARCLEYKYAPVRFLTNKRRLRLVQKDLVEQGAPLFWFDDIGPEHVAFAAAQFLAVTGLMPASNADLHFRPDDCITKSAAAASLAKLLRLHVESSETVSTVSPLELCARAGLFSTSSDHVLDGTASVSALNLVAWNQHQLINVKAAVPASEKITRAEFARWLYQVAQTPEFFGRH
ncbi:MAG: FAD-dependent oxidoreductase [Candidatus Obscuribacterales bacterium]|nr:FAD-dependent oxidoreductase [Candidatus Obscuribacterales bacterium]